MTGDKVRQLIDQPGRRSEVSALALAETFLERAEKAQPLINAFFQLTPDVARSDATAVDRHRADGHPLPLDGMPIAIKDNIDLAGTATTIGSILFKDNVPSVDADVIRRLRVAGAVILGKAALHEFVYGTTCTNPWFGQTRNPWDLDRIPGGSSGGSGAALAADLCIGALGTDTGGSVRIPSSLNGVTGLRPTFGRISNRGVYARSWNFDTVGPMARSVVDLEALYKVLAGFDPADPRSAQDPAGRDAFGVRPASTGARGLRIGIPQRYFFEELDSAVEVLVRAAIESFRGLGAILTEVELSGVSEARAAQATISQADGFALHHRLLEQHPEQIGSDIRQRLAMGREITGANYALALRTMYEWRRQIEILFEDIDLLITPTTPSVAPRIEDSENVPTSANLARFTLVWSLAGVPAISMPCGFSPEGLPAGVQLVAAHWQEETLLGATAAYQSVTQWHHQHPPDRTRFRAGDHAAFKR